ncbi:lytic transglycosylase domain-containing protein [Pseudomonas sp. CGJS7]|uniref:lytic transglycosylase domain-containing protein n=1 Tax=Pseudomonas sp. CGJS7 TaxID=3109348 RepID=UPI00300B688F
MLPGIELTNCTGLAVPHEVMHHVVRVESSFNPYAIGVVGGRLVRQPKNLPEAISTVRMLERRGFNFSLGVAQVNRYNLGKYGLDSYEKAFDVCPNLQAGSRILAECYSRSQDWGKSFSCYYSGNFVTGFRHGYVQKIYASMRSNQAGASGVDAIAVVGDPKQPSTGAPTIPAMAPAVYAPARRSASSRTEALIASRAREPDTAATQAAASAAMLAASIQSSNLAANLPMAAAAAPAPAPAPMLPNMAAAVPQLSQPVTVSLTRGPAAAPPRAPAQPPSQGDQAFVF